MAKTIVRTGSVGAVDRPHNRPDSRLMMMDLAMPIEPFANAQ
jgi:hypothetical protein